MSAAASTQTAFDFESLLGTYATRTLLNVPEVCRILHRKNDYVDGLIDEGKLHGHSAGARSKDRKTVTTRSVALFLAETALYEAADYEARVRDLFSTWTPAQRAWAMQTLAAMRR